MLSQTGVQSGEPAHLGQGVSYMRTVAVPEFGRECEVDLVPPVSSHSASWSTGERDVGWG